MSDEGVFKHLERRRELVDAAVAQVNQLPSEMRTAVLIRVILQADDPDDMLRAVNSMAAIGRTDP